MAKVTFKTRKGANKSASIQLFFNYGSKKRLRYSTGLKVSDIKNWDNSKMRIKNVVAEVQKNEVNNKLTDIHALIEKTYTDLAITKNIEVTNQMLKEVLDQYLNKNKVVSEKPQHLELLPFYKWFIEHYQKNPLVTTGAPMASGTAKTYRNAYSLLKKFNDTVLTLSYNKINVEFYDEFLNYLHDNNYSLNYIGTQIKILKTIMNASFEKNYHSNLDFRKTYFKKPFEEVYNIYLNTDELQKIFELDFSNFEPKRINKDFVITKDKLEISRDLFLISANTGLRVSDFNNLSSKSIITENGSCYISIITKKNSKRLTIPINSTVNNILDKRNGNPPNKMTEQHINYCLKEIGELAQINEPINKEITKGGIKISNTVSKFELITNHTGRRSFCTNAYKSGMPTIDIMAISGHSTEKVFYNYIKVDDLERAEKISKHKFFN
ncbi:MULTISPECIES: site-specific integrase [Winogradskyella]|jgi:integrase|uniref:site-specific integrase n=1 Tax=Winogradskyella TaxID=286104 RepID=UPI0015B82A39|nr:MULTISPECIES: site-specific integrase [Winogradskyella]QXP77676.1 site-specific integrase [Winogradskyella sp. HaHa_3_26]